MDEMNYLYEIEQAANSYEIAETLNVIRGANPKAEMIYQEHFNKAKRRKGSFQGSHLEIHHEADRGGRSREQHVSQDGSLLHRFPGKAS